MSVSINVTVSEYTIREAAEELDLLLFSDQEEMVDHLRNYSDYQIFETGDDLETLLDGADHEEVAQWLANSVDFDVAADAFSETEVRDWVENSSDMTILTTATMDQIEEELENRGEDLSGPSLADMPLADLLAEIARRTEALEGRVAAIESTPQLEQTVYEPGQRVLLRTSEIVSVIQRLPHGNYQVTHGSDLDSFVVAADQIESLYQGVGA